MQEHELGWFRPVYYASRRLSKAKRNYNTTESEALGMIYSVQKFHYYLLGNKFSFHVDRSSLLYLVKEQSMTRKLAQWILHSKNLTST